MKQSNFFIQLSDNVPCIENTISSQQNHYLENISFILDKIYNIGGVPILAIEESNFDIFKDFFTISSHPESTIVCIRNVSKYDKIAELKNVYLFVDNESELFSNFEKIFSKVSGFIEFKFKENIDLEKLDLQLELIRKFLEVKKTKNSKEFSLVKNLEGFLIKEKFQDFGEYDFFIAPTGLVYNHPGLYYNSNKDNLGYILNFEISEQSTILTRPHLICIVCEAFYCDRSIDRNRRLTKEFKVPSCEVCKLTTLLNKHTTILYNFWFNSNKEIPNDLDKVEEFEPDTFYDFLTTESCISNKIKRINFFERRLNIEENSKN